MIEVPISKKPGIYALINLENGKCYIGKTMNLNQRITQHLGKLKTGQHENKAMQEDYNQDSIFKVVVLEEFKSNISSRELDNAETLYIGLYQAYKEEHGYNKNVLRLDRNSVIKVVASQEINKLLNALESEMKKVKESIRNYQRQEN
jgi:group I intron endonuclease